MKRRAFKLLMFLFAGAIINIAVAWACAVWSKIGFQDHPWKVLDPDRPPAIPSHWVLYDDWMSARIEYFGFSSRQFLAVTVTQDDYGNVGVQIVEAGWPLMALMSYGLREGIAPNADFAWQGGNNVHDFLLPRKIPYFTVEAIQPPLPFRPVWPGFAINTIFYAAIVWMLFAAPFVIRKHVRRKCNQCTACGYSLRENVSEECPECGAAV